MRSSVCALSLLCLAMSSFSGSGQQNTYQREVQIKPNATGITFTANDPRPLLQVIMGLRKEYGWAVNYEDPPYDQSETVMGGQFRWVAGKSFSGTLVLSSAPTSAERDMAMSSLLSAYKQSGNPGSFVKRSIGRDRLDVVGLPRNGELPLLDTLISLPKQDRSIDETVDAICLLVGQARGITLVRGGFVDNSMMNQHVTIGKKNVAARHLLREALSHLDVARVWGMSYDPDTRSYAIGIVPLIRVQIDASGRRSKTQILNSSLQ